MIPLDLTESYYILSDLCKIHNFVEDVFEFERHVHIVLIKGIKTILIV
jgi:hypothetical protein